MSSNVWCVQAYSGEAATGRQATGASGRHAAPEDCDPLLTRFAWNLDQEGAQMQLWVPTLEETINWFLKL